MKKVLSFVLILALVLGSFSFAFGLSDVTEATANSEAITVNNDLGIIMGYPDGSFKPDQAVNRAEFAAMMTRALGVPESALAGFSATSFKDTSGYGWAVKYLAFCESKGIMIGDGYGNVMPGRTINVNEAMTMVLRSVGYTENSALLVGTWPSKYVTIAQDLGLYDDVAAMVMVDRGNAAQIIYNALTVTKVQVDADGTTTLSPTDANMLTSGLGATVEDASIVRGSEDSKINLQKYIGAYAIKYTKSGDIIAIGDVKSTFLTGEVKAGNKFKADGVTYTNLTSGAFSTATSAAQTFKNGVVSAPAVAADLATVGDMLTVAVKLSGKQIVTIYSVLDWDTAYGGDKFMFEKSMLEDTKLNNFKFTLDDDDDIDYNSFQLRGIAKLSDLEADNVVYLYTDGTNITRVDVGTKVVKGLVSAYITADNEYVIDGNAYAMAGTLAGPTVGDNVEAYIDYAGDVFDFDVVSGTTNNYAVLIATGAGTGVNAGTYEAKIFTKDGEEKVVSVKTSAWNATVSTAAVNAIVKYELNSSGTLTKLDETNVSPTLSGQLNKARTLFAGQAVDPSVVVFVKDGTDYSIGSIDNMDTETPVILIDATHDGGSKIKAMIAPTANMGNADTVWAVLNTYDAMVNGDGDTVQYITGFADGKTFNAYTDVNNMFATTTSAGLVELTVDADGVVTATSATITSYGAATVTVVAVDGKLLQIATGSSINGVATTALQWISLDANVVLYVYDSVDDEWEVKTVSSTLLKNKGVMLYQVDKDSAVYDIAVVK